MIIIGFFLPEWMVQYSDRNSSGMVKLEPIALSQMDTREYSVLDSLNLLQSYPQNVDKVAIEISTNFDSTSVKSHLMTEIDELSAFEILPPIEWMHSSIFQIDVGLFTLKSDPSIHAIMWSISFENNPFSGDFYLDDATGKVIAFRLATTEHTRITGRAMIEAWADYLDLEAKNIQGHTIDPYVLEDDMTKVSEDSYQVYYFNLGLHNHFLPSTYYISSKNYGFGDTSRWTLRHDRTVIKIRQIEE